MSESDESLMRLDEESAQRQEAEPERGKSGAVDDVLGAARRVAEQTRENAMHLSSVLSQSAYVLETSAALA